METWQEAGAKLATLTEEVERDEYIDELVTRALSSTAESEMTSVFMLALQLARHNLTLRSAALALAITASDDEEEAVDALVRMYHQHRRHAFLAPAFLDVLALLALRNRIARAEIANLLIRLTHKDSRYLLIKGAKIITILDVYTQSLDLRQKLLELAACNDIFVQAEIAVQRAFLELADTLLSSTTQELHQRLTQTKDAFKRAGQIEEHRPDAELFACLVEMLLVFNGLAYDRVNTAQRLRELFDNLSTVLVQQWMPSYRSEIVNICISHILGIADALKRSAISLQGVEDWTNFDEALTELAALYSTIRAPQEVIEGFALSPSVYIAIADTFFVPSLGPVLRNAVGRRRLANVTKNYVTAYGEDELAKGLHTFEQIVATLDQTESNEENAFAPSAQLIQLASHFGQAPESMIADFFQARSRGTDGRWLQQLGLRPGSLSVDRPELFEGNGPVDEASKRILGDLQTLLNPYPDHKWLRLFRVVPAIMSFAKFVFDDLPVYVRCEEDGGKGQKASEKDLQEHLFAWLRQKFDDEAVYEITPIGGGRVDTGLKFPDLLIPIEVKHEFSSIDPYHIRTNYLAQADIYAAATGHVSFLLILDLRDTQAKKHKNRVAQARKSGVEEEIVSLYGWQDGFKVDALPTDPQLPNAKPNAIIIGLIPGNRPRPSSTTHYSSRPSSLSKERRSSQSNI